MSALRILVADDHEVVRRGLCVLLKSHAGWEVCGEAADGREAVDKAKLLKPDIVILDIGMPNLNGLTAARQILRAHPEQKILILTITDAEQVVREVLDAGARGFVLKSDAARDLLEAVDALEHNRTFFTSGVTERILDGYLSPSAEQEPSLTILSPREREIVQLLAEGRSSKEIASTLDLSVSTVETHRSNIMRKLDIHSISELVLYAVRNNIVQVQAGPTMT
ncbi:MAG TPA: response regulator transcription factor [Terriglobales bacterium]|jgi:DNA-binding NarL/FixJ family response regulator|nr:response regulator transcription factor [Terriglobales bacterium]